MALRHAILATLLNEGPASGYDLAKSFDISIAKFWVATPQQLYRELDKLESDGCVVAQVVEQEKRPNKRLFSLTEVGRAMLAEYTTIAPKPTAIRDDLLVQLQAIDAGDGSAVLANVGERLRGAREKLTGYRKLRDRILNGRNESDFFTTAAHVGPYLTLLRGISFEEENIRWCEMAIAVLRERAADTDSSPAE
ncbi:putative PadR family transcriptional regulator [Gordonia effusa NBRC 100432]|uniref:Putative PadR family transcriptional regulator n=1 Tax=Gordonia effusa NBRC 100432 TaxID=1077974 RepID=H0R3J2_9ACTN|nr:PadR family transcriptional regulator [Gordonia effusa]GAB19643.1 putative PadR family transcriptional regulator [Gordonia effusa NBRC 100432]